MDTPKDTVDFPDPLKGALKTLFGMDYLFPYQRLVISNILEAAEAQGCPILWPDSNTSVQTKSTEVQKPPLPDENTDRGALGRQIVILPTGAGKSLCFQLPAMLLSGPTLVIYPILSLMADQERRLRERGFSPVLLRGGQSPEERNQIWEDLRSGKSRFVIANPEVLLSPRVLEKLKTLNLAHLVIDEAHCVSEWGESFRPSYLEIGEIIKACKGQAGEGQAGEGQASPDESPKSLLITAFTATASSAVLEKIEKYIFGGEGRAQRIIGNPDRINISYGACGALLRDLAVRDLLEKSERPAIVFCSSRGGAEKLSRYLRNSFDDREIKFYHAGLSREEKTAVEKWFFPNPRGILVSTCAYGMGVDKADIRTVIHRDCPPSVEAYLQESGRAGRDGKASAAVLLWGPEDEHQLRRAATNEGKKRLEGLLAYARNTGSCRREELLKLLDYEGSTDSPGENCCDVCRKKSPGPALSRKGALSAHAANPGSGFREEGAITDFIRRNRRVFTINEAASFMGKAKNINCTEQEAGELLLALLSLGKIRKSRNPLWKNRLIA